MNKKNLSNLSVIFYYIIITYDLICVEIRDIILLDLNLLTCVIPGLSFITVLKSGI